MNRAARVKPLRCPSCGSGRSRVVNTRDEPLTVAEQLHWPDDALWRLRECLTCGRTYGTGERVTENQPVARNM